jgi:hypothetical protein
LVIKQQDETGGVIINPDMPCVRATNQLIDISKLECCCLGGQQTDLRYVPSLDVVVSPGPTYFLDACAGFCQNGNYNPTSETCQNGPSQRFQSCVNLTRPINCTSPAMPVAVNGIQFYYIHSATNQECPASAACAPAGNMCPIQRQLISQSD